MSDGFGKDHSCVSLQFSFFSVGWLVLRGDVSAGVEECSCVWPASEVISGTEALILAAVLVHIPVWECSPGLAKHFSIDRSKCCGTRWSGMSIFWLNSPAQGRNRFSLGGGGGRWKSQCPLSDELIFLDHNMGVRTCREAETHSLFLLRVLRFFLRHGILLCCCQRQRLGLETAGASFWSRLADGWLFFVAFFSFLPSCQKRPHPAILWLRQMGVFVTLHFCNGILFPRRLAVGPEFAFLTPSTCQSGLVGVIFVSSVSEALILTLLLKLCWTGFSRNPLWLICRRSQSFTLSLLNSL